MNSTSLFVTSRTRERKWYIDVVVGIVRHTLHELVLERKDRVCARLSETHIPPGSDARQRRMREESTKFREVFFVRDRIEPALELLLTAFEFRHRLVDPAQQIAANVGRPGRTL